MLEMIEERYDCSDFLMCGLIRYLHNYPVEGAMKERIKDVMINYRYWMDMDGFDGMCFWSENHALMFYTCARMQERCIQTNIPTCKDDRKRTSFIWKKQSFAVA